MKTITISFFKAHISEQLKRVRKGARIVISERETPIAEVVPYSAAGETALEVRSPVRTPFVVPKSPVRIDHDPVEYLTEDRASR
jgi:prevent-host-death family protein